MSPTGTAISQSVKNDMEAWAGCIAGARLEDEFLGKIRNAGFGEVTSDAKVYDKGKGLASAAVVAVKPGGGCDCGDAGCC